MLRKKNKLPAERHSVDFQLEYGEATIEVHKDSIDKNEKILVIDDLIATGGTAEAAAKLIEMSGGTVAGFIFVINLFDLPGKKMLEKNIYVVGFSYPVVPHNEARIRVQISASHTKEQINDCVDSFADIAKNYGIL